MADLTFRLLVKDDGTAVVGKFADKVGDTANKTKKSTNKMTKGFKNTSKGIKASTVATIALGVAIVGLGVIAAKRIFSLGVAASAAARDFEEAKQKFGVVFQSVAVEATKLRDSLANDFGLSTVAATELLSATGDLLTGFGFTDKQALELSGTVNKLAVDLASFSNLEGGAARASEILTKALLGERDSLVSLGVKISEEQVKAQLLADGKDKLTGASLQQAKASAALTLILKATIKAQGDFQRSSTSLANQQKILSGRFEDLLVVIGEKINPVINKLTGEAIKIIKATKEWADANGEAISQGFKDGLVFVLKSFNLVVTVVGTLVQTFFSAKAIFNSVLALMLDGAAAIIGAYGGAAVTIKRTFFSIISTVASGINELLEPLFPLIARFDRDFALAINSVAAEAGGVAINFERAGKAIKDFTKTEVITNLENLATGFRTTAKEATDAIFKIEDFTNKIIGLSDKLKGLILKPEVPLPPLPPIAPIAGGENQELAAQKAKDELLLKQQRDFNAKTAADKKKEKDDADKLRREGFAQTASETSNFFGALGALAASGGKENFEQQKKFQIASAIASTFAGAARALNLPFPASLFAFGAVVAQGLSAVRNIKATTPGGGGGGGGGAVPSIPTTPQFDQVPDADIDDPGGAGPNITINVSGFVGDDAQLASAIADVIREAVGDDVDFGLTTRGT